MEFLYKLYSNDFFGIGLFMVITVLAFAFLIILFFGKRDEKARNAEKEINNEIENQNISMEGLQSETLTTPIESIVEKNETPKFEEMEIKEEPNYNIQTGGLNDEQVSESISFDTEQLNENFAIPDSYVEENNKNTDDFNKLDGLFRSKDRMYEEEYTKDESFNKDNGFVASIENETENFSREQNNFNRPIIEEPKESNIFSTVTEEEPKRSSMPAQFSSVYLSTDGEEQNNVQGNIEEEEEISPIPLKSEFDMPKPFDLPKLNRETDTSSSSNIINTSSDNSIFKNFGDNSFDFDKKDF